MKTPTRHVSRLIIVLSFLGGSSCSTDKIERIEKIDNKAEAANIESANNRSHTTPLPTGDEANVPVNIAGSYLTCALRKTATENDLSQEYGCFLADAATGEKIVQDPLLNWKSSAPSGLEFIEPDSDYTLALYNTLLVVTGNSKAEIDQRVLDSDIIPSYGFQTILINRLYNVLRPAYEVKDFQAPIVRDQAIEADRGAPPVDPF